MNVVYKENSPFPAGQMSHTGCILCDTWLRGTIYNFFAKQQNKLMTDKEMAEAAKYKEERKKAKEDKKKQQAEQAAQAAKEGGGQSAQNESKKAKKKKKGGATAPDLLTA